jgi:hypothetical protein
MTVGVEEPAHIQDVAVRPSGSFHAIPIAQSHSAYSAANTAQKQAAPAAQSPANTASPWMATNAGFCSRTEVSKSWMSSASVSSCSCAPALRKYVP